jgi:hypothetical protein
MATTMETCGICGGDGRIQNSFGNETTCPSCHGSGRKNEDGGLRDVTKTKPSHHRPTNKAAVTEKQTWPTTFEGGRLAIEVRDSALASDTKSRLTREIIEYEQTHGKVTQTFTKKVRKQTKAS